MSHKAQLKSVHWEVYTLVPFILFSPGLAINLVTLQAVHCCVNSFRFKYSPTTLVTKLDSYMNYSEDLYLPLYKVSSLLLLSLLLLQGQDVKYSLRAFISHVGSSPSTGHYKAFVKNGTQWFTGAYAGGVQGVQMNPPFKLMIFIEFRPIWFVHFDFSLLYY